MNIAIDESMIPYAEKIMNGEYDIPGLELSDGATVLDIGACCGEFTAWALERWPTCKVIAYEPNPEALKYLYENFQDNDRVNIVPKAVSRSKSGSLSKGKNNLGECSFRDIGDGVDCIAELPESEFVKIDVEGMEVEVLDILKRSSSVRGIAIEFHSKDLGNKCLERIGGAVPTELGTGIIKARFSTGGVPEVTIHSSGDVKQYDPSKTGAGVFIGVPIHYQPTSAFMLSCMALKDTLPSARWRVLQGDSHPDRARHRIIADFLESDCDYLVFIDADLKFEARQIESLVKRSRDIICGFYAKKTPGPPEWVGNAINPTPDEDGLVVMREAGTGCLVIHRRVFEAIIRAYPELRYQADPNGKRTEWAVCQSGVFWDPNAKRRRWLSEDWALCWRARSVGFTIYGDPDVVCIHEGSCFFPTEPGDAKKEDAKE